jgi:hypothetical protein
VADADRKVETLHPVEAHRRDSNGGSGSIEQWTAAVAWIERRVGLHERRVAALADGAHDATRDRILQGAQRRSDREYFLPDTNAFSESHLDRCLAGKRVDAQDGDVEERSRPFDTGGRCRPVHSTESERGAVADDVDVGEQRVWRDVKRAPASSGGFDADDGWHHAVHHVLERRGWAGRWRQWRERNRRLSQHDERRRWLWQRGLSDLHGWYDIPSRVNRWSGSGRRRWRLEGRLGSQEPVRAHSERSERHDDPEGGAKSRRESRSA